MKTKTYQDRAPTYDNCYKLNVENVQLSCTDQFVDPMCLILQVIVYWNGMVIY